MYIIYYCDVVLIGIFWRYWVGLTISPQRSKLKKLLVRYSSLDLNSEPLDEQTILDHSNIKLVHYSDPHCIFLELCISTLLAEIRWPQQLESRSWMQSRRTSAKRTVWRSVSKAWDFRKDIILVISNYILIHIYLYFTHIL